MNRSAASETSVATTSRDVATRTQGLDAASGAEVERRVRRGVGSCSAARVREAPPTPSTWSSGSGAAERGLVEVARDPPLSRSAVVGERLRADDRPRADVAVHPGGEPEPARARRRPVRGERRRHATTRAAASRARGVGRARPAGRRRSPSARVGGAAQSAGDRRVGRVAPRGAQRLGREARVAEVGGECAAQRGVGFGKHASIQPPRPARAQADGAARARARHGLLGGSDRRIAPDRAVMNRTGAKSHMTVTSPPSGPSVVRRGVARTRARG